MGLTTKFAQKLTVPFSSVLSADPDNKPSGSGPSLPDVVDDYVAKYTFDDAGSQGTNDQGNATFDATMSGTTSVVGKVNNAADFDGITDIGYIPYGAGGPFYTDNVSVSLWVKVNTFVNESRIVSRREYPAQPRNFSLRLGTANNFRFSSNVGQWDGGTVSLGVWQHLVLTYDNTTRAIKVYLDDSLVINQTTSSAANLSTITSSSLTSMGAYRGSDTSTGNFLDGELDEVRFYDRVLSAAEVTEIYNHEN